jgi:DNA mismatch repair protein MutS
MTGCRTLFATHYHELTALTERMSRMFNMTMRVREHAGELVFLHEVALGAADRSYGIHVAELAGLPTSVTERAKVILETLEESRSASPLTPTLDGLPLFEVDVVRQPETDALRDALTEIDPDRLSPRDALDWLYRLRKML